MLLIPGLMSTNAIRDVLIGDTLSGIIRLIAALLLAAALALGFMGAIIFIWEVWTLNTQAIIQLITGAVGSVAFGMLFHMKSKYLPLAGAGGFLSWLVFLLGKPYGEVFFCLLFWLDLLRICMRKSLPGSVRKLPLPFFVTSVIPLIPGSTLYYCMNSIMEGNTMQALAYGRDTFLFAFGIAAGMSIGWAICYFFRTVKANEPLGFLSARGSFASTFFLSAF